MKPLSVHDSLAASPSVSSSSLSSPPSPGSQAWESGSGGSRALPLRPHLRRLDHTMSAAISAAASWSAMKTIRRRAVSTSALTSACHVRNTAATNGRPLCPRDGAVARDSAAAVRRRAQLWCKLRALPPMNRLQRSPCALTRGRGEVNETEEVAAAHAAFKDVPPPQRRRPLFGKLPNMDESLPPPLWQEKGAQRLIHIRQLRRAISCTEPKRRGRTQARRFAPGALVAGLVAYVGRTSS